MRISYFFWGFLSWIAESSRKLGIKKLYFFTREGEFFKTLYDQLAKNSLYRSEIPEAALLEVSRMSTFFPSLRTISIEECKRIWNQYTVQSMDAFFRSLHLDLGLVKHILNRHQIPIKEQIRNPSEDSRIQELFQDQEFLSVMERQQEEKRALLYAYLRQNGWKQEEKDRIGVVDIGWRGTIQDNLCFLYPDYKIFGFYTALQPFLSKQPENARKYAYINAFRQKGLILLSVRPLEMLCNSKNGSTVGYQRCEGRVKAVKKTEKEEAAAYEWYAKKAQAEIRNDQRKCMFQMRICGSALYRKKAMRGLFQFIAYPDRRSVRAYFLLNHNEEFGMGEYVHVKEKYHLHLFLHALFGKRGIDRCKKLLLESGWPQGCFVRFYCYPLLPVYHLLLSCHLRKAKRK